MACTIMTFNADYKKNTSKRNTRAANKRNTVSASAIPSLKVGLSGLT